MLPDIRVSQLAGKCGTIQPSKFGYIPAWRWDRKYLLKWDREYLLKIAIGSGLANYACFVGELHPRLRPFSRLLAMVFVAVRSYRLALYYLQHHRDLKTNLAKACHFNSMLGKILSPFLTPRPIAYQRVSASQSAPKKLLSV